MEYSIYNRDLTAEETRGAAFHNPIATADKIYDNRDEHNKHAPSCEGDRCTLSRVDIPEKE
jgi:hypothetical protein